MFFRFNHIYTITFTRLFCLCVCVFVQVLGRVLMLRLIDELVRGYRNNETWSLQLLNSTRIHILPTMNPDGFDASDTDCQYSQGRCSHTQLAQSVSASFSSEF